MIQTGIKLKTIIGFLKENLSILIVVPAFIGGLWQAIELMSISISYVRFFSISQIVPDGILILVLFLIGVLPHLLTVYYPVLFNVEEKKEIEKIESENLFKYLIIFFVIFYIIGIIYFLLNIFFIYKVNSLSTDIMVATATIYILNIMLNLGYNSNVYNSKKLFKFCNIFLALYYLLVGFYFIKTIHNSFLLTDKLHNIENVKCLILEKYPNKEMVILYFNDKYIFIKIFDKTIFDKETKKPFEYIYILKFENLFNN